MPLHRPDVHRRLEKLKAPAPIFLGLVHCRVRVLDERVGVRAIGGIDADADTCGDVEIVLVDEMRPRHRLQHSSRRDGRVFRAINFQKQNDEFVAALPADGIRAAYAFHQTRSDRLQELVAGRMPERIVDVLEAVQIQEQHRDALLMTRR